MASPWTLCVAHSHKRKNFSFPEGKSSGRVKNIIEWKRKKKLSVFDVKKKKIKINIE
jgi:hypothetical protein